MTAARELATWALALSWQEIPSDVQEIVKEHCADGVGNAIGGLVTEIARAAAATVVETGNSDAASMWGGTQRTSVPSAAFYNSILIHALDFDDTHAGGLVHATAPTLSTAWALGESLNKSGEEVITAYAVGLEIICRLGGAAPYGFHSRGLHATQVCGSIASSVVASRLMRLSLEQTVNAMGIAGSFSGGLLEFLNTGSSTKQIHPGIAAQAGITAATLAAHGATGPQSVLEGEYGIYETLSNREVDIGSITNGLGSKWEAAQITIKPYPACQLSHVTLDAVKLAWAEAMKAGYTPSDVQSINAVVHPDSARIVCEPLIDKFEPTTPYAAKFSLPWSAAALIVDGTLVVTSFSDASISRKDVSAIARKFGYSASEDDVPAAAASGSVSILAKDGQVFTGRVSASSGSPTNRLSREALADKFIAQCLNSEDAGTVFEEIFHIEDLAAISTLSAKLAYLTR